MSANEHDHDEHGHGGGSVPGGDHVPHVLPYVAYMGTWITLMVLTVITVAASYMNFGPANLLIAVTIATIKATVVAAIFMHLAFDQKLHSLILSMAGLFLAIFISITMSDTEGRGHAEAIEAERPADISNPFMGGSTKQKAMKQLFAPAGISSAKLTAPGVEPGLEPPPAASSAAPAATAGAVPSLVPVAPSAVPSASTQPSGSAVPSAMASAPASASASVVHKH